MVKSVEEVVKSGEESGGGWICREVVESVEEVVELLEEWLNLSLEEMVKSLEV